MQPASSLMRGVPLVEVVCRSSKWSVVWSDSFPASQGYTVPSFFVADPMVRALHSQLGGVALRFPFFCISCLPTLSDAPHVSDFSRHTPQKKMKRWLSSFGFLFG